MKKSRNIEEVKKAADAFSVICEEEEVNYAIFYAELPHSLTGGATFTPEEFAILIETLSRRLPLTQVHFLRQVMDMVIEERSASDDSSSSSSTLLN